MCSWVRDRPPNLALPGEMHRHRDGIHRRSDCSVDRRTLPQVNLTVRPSF